MQKTSPQEMGKMWVEFCIVSARGLHRPSLWKLHWFAVAWVDPNDKYCTRIDASGNPNPVWRTKFSAVVDAAAADCALHVEVYSRDPLFLREKLHGSAQVSLKEFLADEEMKSDLGSFHLRRNRNGSNKPKGFVDVSVRTSMDKQSAAAGVGADYEGFQLAGNSNVINLAREREAGPVQVQGQGLHRVPFRQPPNPAPPIDYTYTHPAPYPSNYNNPSLGGPSYPPAASYSYPPPPLRVVDNASSSYLNLPPSAGGAAAAAAGLRPAFAAGVGAGALAAGAVIFGDDFMSSGLDLPSVGLRYPSLDVSIDPPF